MAWHMPLDWFPLNIRPVQVAVSSAGWLSASPLSSLTVVQSIDNKLVLAALFDSHGSSSAAEFCTLHVTTVFEQQSECTGSIAEALQQTFTQLDSDYLLSPSIPDKDKAESGASGSIVVLDLRAQKIHVGRVGSSGVALGLLVHGLAAQLTEGSFVEPPGAAAMDGASTAAAGCLIGEGRLKVQKLAELYNKGSRKGSPVLPWSGPQQMAPASITAHAATVLHEHIIIGSAGFWTHLSADDAVLRSHFFVKASAPFAESDAQGSRRTAAVALQLAHYANRMRHWKKRGPDAVCIALTLRWPATSLNQAFPTQKGSFMETQRQCLDPATPSGRASLRWRQVRMLFVQFRRARSRALRKKWLDLVAEAMAEGRKRAVEIEKLYWAKHQAAVRVTPSGKVTDSHGKELMPIAISAISGQA